ncbi:NUDIX domain-containing protein [Sulfitobacter geojensis]|jgi:8-oxo-dGTP diphosphatase|uniref:NUDIX hydrolase n=1 Tax=Sulfitobacter geojensis TaxID=1342299 RepID=A0AAE3B620_9RHOB|nr:NUDIX hydrolase [Sulfitobacter geojensis]MBM1689387.1 NUDIX hydrolase [Sulfitobacter geojensis]MBM1693453.1 NUDIX hydrolase [Sulfitobacter geojensis]MBM1705619.1 NUDIX hydrolase [Sulfitobacter geojensis]MBM1709677.1 NUDIX hydrolase [Sulfitobacter geojensis]MBM1713743.1 NUDIX hydrolase [Sulfitobacter geojensis]
MIRRVGAPPLAQQHYRLRPGVYAILPLKRRFLLTAQVTDKVDVQLPGGGIDPGESPLQALHREVLEEIGWRIATPLRLGAFRRFVYMPEYDLWAEKLCHVYVAHPVRQIAEPIEPDHITLVMSGNDAVDALGNAGDSMFMRRFIG